MEPPVLKRKMKSQADRHARGSGQPGNFARQVRRLAWLPACAGMTLLLALVAGTSAALAHTGAEHALSFAAGIQHPFTGLDHSLAMVAVGLWAGLVAGAARWIWPAAFVSVMVLGGAAGMAGVRVPMVETGILASVIVLGLLVLTAARLPLAAGAVLIGVFALLHGHAHGAELPADMPATAYAMGFVLATALLHGTGLAVAYLAAGDRRQRLVRGAGGVVAAAGVALALM
jgi:urease accessory protein